MKRKVLVIGASGLLGSTIIKVYSHKYELFGTYNRNPIDFEESYKLDVTDRKAVIDLVDRIKPDLIIDTHSITNVDYCELNPEEAWHVNVDGTKNVVEASKIFGCKLIFISTDYVFDGKKNKYSEKDKPKPINFYGKTKFVAEKVIEAFDIDYIIVRTSVLYGIGGKDKKPFPIWVLENLKKNKEIKVAIDQFNNPTYAKDLAEILFKLYEKNVKGLFHVVGKDNVSRYEFAIKTAEIFSLDSKLIKKSTSVEIGQTAPRPRKLLLSTHKLERITGITPVGIENGLRMLKEEMIKEGLL